MMKRLLDRLAPLTIERPRTLWAIALLLTLLMLPGMRMIKISNDYAELLPEHSPSLKALHELSEKIEGLGEFVVVFEEAPIDKMALFADEMSKRVEKDPLIRRVRYRTKSDYFEARKFLYIPLEDLQELVTATKRKIKEDQLKGSPVFIDLGVQSEAEETLDEIKRKYDVDQYFSYFTDDDRKTLLLLISPRAFPDDVEAAEHLYKIAKSAEEDTRRSGDFKDVKTSYGGPYMELLYDHDILNRDIPRGGTLTALLILLLLWISYRSGWAMLILLGPLAMTILWSFSMAGYLIPGGLNSMSSFLGMILFGLGIDFGIHILNRYGEERKNGKTPEDSVRLAVTDTGLSCVYAALTSAAAFYLLAVAKFRGYTQFGLLAGTGVIVSCVGILVLLPATITIFEKRGWTGFVLKARDREDSFYAKLAAIPVRNTGLVLVITLLVSGLAVWGALKMHVNFDVSKYRPRSKEITEVENHSREILEITSSPGVYSVTGKEQVDDVIEALRKRDSELPQEVILQIRSIRDLLPEDEEEKRALLAGLDRTLARQRNLAEDPEDIKEIDDFRAEIRMPEVNESDLPQEVAQEFKFGENGYLVYLFADHAKGTGPNFALDFARAFGGVTGKLGSYTAAGPLMIEAEILVHLLHYGPRIMLYALVAVVVLVIFLFWNIRYTLLSLATLGIGFLWASGTVGAYGGDINVFNVVTLPAIIGLSIDYGIHVLHRYQMEGPGSMERVLAHTGASVWMSALTTVAGFGGLVPSHHAGLRSLGLVAMAGIFFAVLSVAFFCPALAVATERHWKKKAPAHEEPPVTA